MERLEKMITRQGRGDRFLVLSYPGFLSAEHIRALEYSLGCVSVIEDERFPKDTLMLARGV